MKGVKRSERGGRLRREGDFMHNFNSDKGDKKIGIGFIQFKKALTAIT